MRVWAVLFLIMSIEANTLVATARELLTETDPALEVSNERLHALVQPTVSEWRRRTLANREKLKNFMIVTSPLAITGGRRDLTTELDTYGIPSEEIKRSDVLVSTDFLSGSWTFKSNPTQGETIVVNGVTVTFRYADITVTGSGTSAVDGTYAYVGVYNGRPSYSDGTYTLRFDSDDSSFPNNWVFVDGSGNVHYYAEEDVATPQEVAGGYAVNPIYAVGPGPTLDAVGMSAIQVEIGGTRAETAANFAAALNASVNALLTVATYVVDTEQTGRHSVVIGTYDTPGDVEFTMAPSSEGHVTVSGATFTSAGDALTAVFVNSHNRLKLGGRQDRFFLCAYFDGKTIYFRDPNSSGDSLRTLNGTMTISVIVVPVDLTNVPSGLIGELATIMADMVRMMNTGQQPRGVNLSEMKGG